MPEDVFARLSAALQGRYSLERKLGEGGMASVYLAQDVKHQRQVAIKVLKPELAAVLGAERFVQEITTTAQLQHPHILSLFDSGEADGFLFYVMPYVEGETLRDKLNRETQLGVDEAVRMAREIADALDYAHRRGVIHRDIKPENILLHDGRPTVADFGIALALSAAAGGRMTETGMSLGTPHYMSPEQATADQEITGRSDVYSLASVLYEMLTGNPPHTGSSAQQIIVRIIADEARPVESVRKSVPPNVAAALAKALEKLPADRFESAQAFADALADPHFTTRVAGAGAPAPDRSSFRHRVGPFVLGAAAMALVAAVAWMTVPGRSSGAPLPVVRAEMDLGGRPMVTLRISPDGSTLLMSGSVPGSAVVRSLADTSFTRVEGAGMGDGTSFSPDGREVAFVEDDARLVRRSLADGTRTVIASVDSLLIRGADVTWGAEGIIVLRDWTSFWQVAASGGQLERVPVEPGAGEIRSPRFLSDGRRLLATRRTVVDTGMAAGRTARYELVIVSLDGSVEPVGAQGRYGMVVDAGFLVTWNDSKIWSYPFDARRGRVTGEPRLLATDANIAFDGPAYLDVSPNGVLAWLSEPPPRTEIVVTDRAGRGAALPLEVGGNDYPRFSPDGRRLAFARGDNQITSDLWIWDFAGSRATRVTADSLYGSPEWSADTALVFTGQGGRLPGRGGMGAWRIRVGGGNPEPIFFRTGGINRPQILGDGRTLIFHDGGGQNRDIFRVTLDSLDAIQQIVSDPADDHGMAVSRDGRWLAFVSDRTRTPNVYVRRLDGDSQTWQVSPDGGEFPRWGAGDGELLFLRGDSVMAVQLSDANPPAGAPRALFAIPGGRTGVWDVTADGQRFAFVRTVGEPGRTRVRLLLNAFRPGGGAP